MTTREDLQLSLDAYDAKVAKAIAKFPERQHLSEKRLYTPLDIDEKFDYNSKLGFPGQYPFTRGVQPTMYRGRLWTMRAYAGFATAEETNARYKYLLQAGQTGLSVAMDLPTQIGLDSDAPLSEGEVGKVGVAIDSLADMEKLFEGIPLDKVSTSMTINGPAAVLLAMYVAVAEKQGVKPEQLKGTIQNDILKEYIARGTYIFPPRPSMRLITDTFAYCSQNIPKWNTISVGAYHIREAGASEVQEIGQDAPPQEQPEIPVPDATISIKEMQDYGYSWDGMFPLKQEAAERLFTQDGIEVFRIYEDGTEGAVTSLTDLQEHAEKGGLFGVEKETWEALHEYNAMKQQLRESEPTKEALLLYGKEDSYGIYQLARGDATRDLRFEPYDRLQATGHTVDRANYELIYTAPLEHGTSLEDIYTRFNIDHPKDFKGHSLSISDIVVLHQNGENTAHYVDRIGFQNVPEFLQEKQAQLIPDEHLTGEQIRTPRGSFYVSDMSVEQMKEAGYGLHHQSDDGKYLIMGNGTRAFAVAAEQPEKTNPLKHIEDTIEQNDNNFDGIINNTPQTPTVDALEQKAKAGEVISLVDLAEAIKTDRENGRGKKAAAKEKPSIRAQLKADKERAGKKKPTKQKSQDLERS